MSCSYCEQNYYGKTGKPRAALTVTIPAAQLTTTVNDIGDALHNNYLTFSCAGMYEGGTGAIRGVTITVNNNTTAFIPESFRLWLFTTAPENQIANTTLNISIVWNKYVGRIDTNPAFPLNEYISINEIDNLQIDYACASDDSALYGVIECISQVQLAANASVTVTVWVEKD
jgi:hypothetical protein